MSYLENISGTDKDKLTIVKHSASGFLVEYFEEIKKELGLRDFINGELKIKNKIFSSQCDITGDFNFSIEFENCYFLNNVFFHDLKSTQRFALNHCFLEKELIIGSNVEIDSFDLVVLAIKSQMVVDGGNIKQGKWSIIDNCRLLVNGGSFDNLIIGYWGGVVLSELSFHLPKVKGSIRVISDKTKIERLDIFQYSSDVTISLEDISVNSISIYRYRNEKSLRLSNIKAFETDYESQFSVVESYLGKAEFYAVDFRSFKSVNILDAHLVDCTFINSVLPKNINAYKGRYVHKNEAEERLIEKIKILESKRTLKKWRKNVHFDSSILNYYQKKRETLRQIKYALSKQGDSINEQKFHSLEMKAHDRSLTWKNNRGTKLIIKASSWTSDFGQSISRPLGCLLAGHWLLFAILILYHGIPNLSFSISGHSCSAFKTAFENYFQLINPLRKNEIPFSGYLILIDIFMRIWASYMIYNIIRASRRFIK